MFMSTLPASTGSAAADNPIASGCGYKKNPHLVVIAIYVWGNLTLEMMQESETVFWPLTGGGRVWSQPRNQEAGIQVSPGAALRRVTFVPDPFQPGGRQVKDVFR